jgi:hypothetical protein
MTRNAVRGILALVCLALMLVSGARKTTANAPSTADNIPPEIWIVSPSDGSTVSGKVKIMFYSFDLGGIDRYELYVDGELKQTLLPNARNLYFVWSSRETGPHTLICRAYDRAGNIGTSPQVNVSR